MASDENAIKRSILEYLKYRGIPATKHRSGTIFMHGRVIELGEAGWPDIIGVLPGGAFIGIEVKTKTGKVEESQQKKIMELQNKGALIYVVHSLKELEEALP